MFGRRRGNSSGGEKATTCNKKVRACWRQKNETRGRTPPRQRHTAVKVLAHHLGDAALLRAVDGQAAQQAAQRAVEENVKHLRHVLRVRSGGRRERASCGKRASCAWAWTHLLFHDGPVARAERRRHGVAVDRAAGGGAAGRGGAVSSRNTKEAGRMFHGGRSRIKQCHHDDART